MRAMSCPGLILLAGVLSGALVLDAHADPAGGGERRLGDLPPVDAVPSSNMGFSVGVRLGSGSAESAPYVLTLPLFLGTGDIADAAASPPCSDAGSSRSDGVVDSLDLLCDLWTSGQGGMWISRHVDSPFGWQSRGIWRAPGGTIVVGGDWLDPITRGEAVSVTVLGPSVNDARIVGSHDPSGNCVTYDAPDGVPATGLVNVFYHTMFQTANELLCGLKGVDWNDLDGDGAPDTCTQAIFDPAFGGSASVSDVRDGLTSVRTVATDPSAPNGMRFEGPDFALEPTRGALFVISPEQPAATWCQPHY